MKTWVVKVRAVVTREYLVEAETAEQAEIEVMDGEAQWDWEEANEEELLSVDESATEVCHEASREQAPA